MNPGAGYLRGRMVVGSRSTDDLEGLEFCNLQRLAIAKAMMKSICPRK